MFYLMMHSTHFIYFVIWNSTDHPNKRKRAAITSWTILSDYQQEIIFMHHHTDRIIHATFFEHPVLGHGLEWKPAQVAHQERSHTPPHSERTLYHWATSQQCQQERPCQYFNCNLITIRWCWLNEYKRQSLNGFLCKDVLLEEDCYNLPRMPLYWIQGYYLSGSINYIYISVMVLLNIHFQCSNNIWCSERFSITIINHHTVNKFNVFV